MKKLIFILFWFCSINLSAGIDFKFSGYIYELPAVAFSNERGSFSNLTNLRFTPELLVGENGRLVMHYEADIMLNKLNLLNNNRNATNRQAVDMNWSILNDPNVKINHFIDRLYYKQMFDFGEITVGRQNLAFGVGRIWQPTDMFNPINPANFSKFEKDGADAIAATVYLGNFSDLKVVYNAYDSGKKGNYAIKYRTNFKGFDYSGLLGYFDDNPAVGADFAGSLWGIGFRGEGLYYYRSNLPDSSYFRGILGADYQFNDKLYGLIEYHYNGRGTNCKYCYVNLLPKLFRGEIQNLSTFYLAAQLSYQVHPLATVSAMNITNLVDRSGMGTLSVNYSASESLNLMIAGAMFYGAEMTEYSYYSKAVYFLAQWYF
ncbi:MAG: hypothetical protein WCR42_07285 [bacterium]